LGATFTATPRLVAGAQPSATRARSSPIAAMTATPAPTLVALLPPEPTETESESSSTADAELQNEGSAPGWLGVASLGIIAASLLLGFVSLLFFLTAYVLFARSYLRL